jgi:hypothetical protein
MASSPRIRPRHVFLLTLTKFWAHNLLSTVSQYETNKIRSDGVSKTCICNEEQMLTYNITLIDIQDKTEYKSE